MVHFQLHLSGHLVNGSVHNVVFVTVLGVHRITVEELISKAINAYKSESAPPPVSVSGTSLASGGQVEPVVEVRVEDFEAPTPQESSDSKIETEEQEVTFTLTFHDGFTVFVFSRQHLLCWDSRH